MGYTTIFGGRFDLDRVLDDKTHALIYGLAHTRRMKRDVGKLEEMGYGNKDSFGVDGEFFIEGGGFMGQEEDASVVYFNACPSTQPGLWLQWVPTDDKKGLEWDGSEKFYHSLEWIEYLIERILKPEGYVVNGIVNAQGENPDDQYHIKVVDNVVEKVQGLCGYVAKPSW